MSEHEADIGPLLNTDESGKRHARRKLIEAIDLASDQGQVTWLTDGGKRIAAIVPVDVAEHGTPGVLR